MLTSLTRRHKIFNKKLHDYCLNSTNESIKKLSEKYNREKKYKDIELNLVTNDLNPNNSNNPNNPIIPLFCFLSISSLIYYFFYSRK
jgi:hypothetical protein